MNSLVLLCLASLTATSEPQIEAEAPRLAGGERVNFSLIAGPSYRTSTAVEGGLRVDYGGAVPPQLKLGVAAYFLSWLGLVADGSAEWFGVEGTGFDGQGTGKVAVAAYSGSLAAALRFMTAIGLAIEVRLGYALGLLPSVSGADGPVVSTPLFHHGPLLAAALSLDRGWPVSAQLRGTIAPIGFGSSTPSGATDNLAWYGAGLELDFGRLSLLGALWTLVLDYEFRTVNGAAAAAGYRLDQMSHRLALGLKGRVFGAAASARPPPPRDGGLFGRVVSPEGKPIAGAAVDVEGRALVADEKGEFRLDKLEPRAWTVAAQATDFKRASETVTVAAGGQATLTLVLPRPSGPGTLVGKVRLKDPEGPAADAVVTVAGKPPVRTAADGSYKVEQAGPGAVSVTVTYPGYLPVEEAVQVPPEAEATLEVKLENKRPLAKLRGRVTAGGRAFTATVSVVEAKRKLTVSGDGRFDIDLPGGSYKVVVEAPGYLTQSRTVNLADGDHTIYYFELRPSLQ